MTPAINLLKKLKIEHTIHEYTHDPAYESFGLEAAEKLNVSELRVFKTLVIELDSKELGVAIVPVSSKLSMKQAAKAFKAKKAAMAPQLLVERATGYILGGVSPLGQKKRLKTVIDGSAQNFETIFVSAGRRGLEIELNPEQLASILSALYFPICQ